MNMSSYPLPRVRGTAVAAFTATGTAVVTKSDAADLSADSAAIAASTVAKALTGALAKSSQTCQLRSPWTR